jgi:hypothetical protein
MLSAARAEEKVARPGDADILPAGPSFGRRR